MSQPFPQCLRCGQLAGMTEPWCELKSIEASGGWGLWIDTWTAVVADLVGGPAHSLWVDSDTSSVTVRLSVGYSRSRLEVLNDGSFEPAERERMAGVGMLRIERPPTVITDAQAGLDGLIRRRVIQEETWVSTHSTTDLDATIRSMAWCVEKFMDPGPHEDVLVQVVQRDRSCEECWEIAAHWYPF